MLALIAILLFLPTIKPQFVAIKNCSFLRENEKALNLNFARISHQCFDKKRAEGKKANKSLLKTLVWGNQVEKQHYVTIIFCIAILLYFGNFCYCCKIREKLFFCDNEFHCLFCRWIRQCRPFPTLWWVLLESLWAFLLVLNIMSCLNGKNLSSTTLLLLGWRTAFQVVAIPLLQFISMITKTKNWSKDVTIEDIHSLLIL